MHPHIYFRYFTRLSLCFSLYKHLKLPVDLIVVKYTFKCVQSQSFYLYWVKYWNLSVYRLTHEILDLCFVDINSNAVELKYLLVCYR